MRSEHLQALILLEPNMLICRWSRELIRPNMPRPE